MLCWESGDGEESLKSFFARTDTFHPSCVDAYRGEFFQESKSASSDLTCPQCSAASVMRKQDE